jgi:hypothetical protein
MEFGATVALLLAGSSVVAADMLLGAPQTPSAPEQARISMQANTRDAHRGVVLAQTPYAPQEFDFGGVDGLLYGTVELVRPASPTAGQPADKAEEALVRLDDGRRIAIVLAPLQHVGPGDRVRVLQSVTGVRMSPG